MFKTGHLIQQHRESIAACGVSDFFFYPGEKTLKKRPNMIGRHNEPSLADMRKFIHGVARGDGSVQDVILMLQHDK